MNFNQLVFRNVIRNGREYLTYFLSSLFSVMVFFIFSLLYFHPDLGDNLRGSSETMSEMATFGIQISEVVIAIMSFIFLWYAFSTFLKGRKQQLSIYLTIGMSQKKLTRMVLYENLMLGLGSIVIGIITSILFSKLILLVSQNILALDQGLPFYFPIKAIMLTVIVYACIFLIISMFTVINLRKLSVSEMKISRDEIVVEPKTSLALTVLGVILIAIGYGLAFLFSFGITGASTMRVGLGILIACVLITILGTWFFFKYVSVQIFNHLKQTKLFYKNGHMLTISNLMQRMKANATMYFMISIVGAVAFVGIGVSKAIGGAEFGRTQGDSFAIVYENNTYPTEGNDVKEHEENIGVIENMIADKGYHYISMNLNPVSVTMKPTKENPLGFLNVIDESQVNEYFKMIGEEPIVVEDDVDIVTLVTTNSERQQIKNEKREGSMRETDIIYYVEKSDDIKEIKVPVQIKTSAIKLSISSRPALAVASSKMYQELKEKNSMTDSIVQVVHYNEWQSDKDLSQEIISFLQGKTDEHDKHMTSYYEEIGKTPYESDLTDEEHNGMMHEEAKGFWYSSMYQTWIRSKQSNGTILLISVLLGSVFFTFSCSIIYFKLFGELEKDGKYHRSLYILGVPEKRRRKMVTTEMLIMFFIPFLMSFFHFIAAMSALKVLIDLPVYYYVFQIMSIYIFFQSVFFIICRRQYLKNLNKYAENIKR